MKLSNIFLGAGAIASVSATSFSHQQREENDKRSAIFKWKGTNVAGAEFGEDVVPGVEGTDYTWPNASAISLLVYGGSLNTFRVPFLMERLAPNGLAEPFDEAYLEGLLKTSEEILNVHAHPVIDPHNFGRYNGEIIDSPDDFKAFWTNLASNFVGQGHVIFDTNNEFHDMDQDLVFDLNQAAIDGIRAAGAEQQWIWVEGNSYTGAWTWPEVNDNLKDLTDPSSRIVYQMHQYLDEDGSGTHETCVNKTIGRARLESATNWLRDNGRVGVLGEFAGGPNEVCESAVKDLFNFLTMNNGLWWGVVWWSAGPWWEDYMFSMEPGTGVAYDQYLPIFAGY